MLSRVEPDGVFGLPDLVSQVTVVEAAKLAFLSGQLAWGDDGNVVGNGSHHRQAECIARRIDRILGELGASRADIVKETIYVVDYQSSLIPDILGALHDAPPPSSTLIGVAALASSEFLVEVECIVAISAAKE